MDSQMGVYVSLGKEDIILDCKYCRKTDKKGFGLYHAYGHECMLKPEKRRCNRCRWCYFGPHHPYGY